MPPTLHRRSAAPRALALGSVLALTATLLAVLVGPPTQASPAVQPVQPVQSAPAAPAARAAQKGTFVVWDTTTIYPGNKIRAHGKVPGGKRKIALQVKVKRSWQTIGKDKSNGKGKFRIRGKLDWYGKHKVRIIAPGRKSFVRGKRVEVLTPYQPIGSKKNFAYFHGSSVRKNYRFNPCQKITYRVNADDVGPEALPLVQAALAQVTWATGMEFRYAGSTHVIPYNYKRNKHYPRGTDLIIAWATHAEVPDFVRRTAAGFGGPRWVYPARNSKGQLVQMSTEAGVTLSTDYWVNGFAHSFIDNTRATMGELILHEVGHAVGLDHVPAAAEEIMNGRGYYRYPDGYYKGLYNLGDLNGLSKVGLKQGCLRKVGRGRATEVAVTEPPLP